MYYIHPTSPTSGSVVALCVADTSGLPPIKHNLLLRSAACLAGAIAQSVQEIFLAAVAVQIGVSAAETADGLAVHVGEAFSLRHNQQSQLGKAHNERTVQSLTEAGGVGLDAAPGLLAGAVNAGLNPKVPVTVMSCACTATRPAIRTDSDENFIL